MTTLPCTPENIRKLFLLIHSEIRNIICGIYVSQISIRKEYAYAKY